MNVQTEEVARELLDEIIKERDTARSLPVLDVRWYVVEVHPAFTDEFGKYIPGEIEQVSPYCKTRSEACKWAADHEENHGSELIIKAQYLREFTVQRWSSF